MMGGKPKLSDTAQRKRDELNARRRRLYAKRLKDRVGEI